MTMEPKPVLFHGDKELDVSVLTFSCANDDVLKRCDLDEVPINTIRQ